MKTGYVKCQVCHKKAIFIFKSKFGTAKKGYCKEHYGDGKWIKKQVLFPSDRWVLDD